MVWDEATSAKSSAEFDDARFVAAVTITEAGIVGDELGNPEVY